MSRKHSKELRKYQSLVMMNDGIRKEYNQKYSQQPLANYRQEPAYTYPMNGYWLNGTKH